MDVVTTPSGRRALQRHSSVHEDVCDPGAIMNMLRCVQADLTEAVLQQPAASAAEPPAAPAPSTTGARRSVCFNDYAEVRAYRADSASGCSAPSRPRRNRGAPLPGFGS
eukprot:865623-Lingulodinium_polyedra.AAC.1